MRQVMLSHVIKCVAIVVVTISTACNQREKEQQERNQNILKISKSTMGVQEYHRLYKQTLDSLNLWCSEQLPGYQSIWSFNYRLDSVLCFNSQKDRMVTGILIQCNRLECSMDDVEYLYGAKIKGCWYFFRGGGTMAILRKNYQKDIRSPLSFEKLHELAMNNMFRGYIKKNAAGKWEINDAFFAAHFEDVGWGDFERYQDTVVNGKRFDNKKEYFENIYMGVVKGNWIRE